MLRFERKSDPQINVLPNELVIDILVRLPGKQIGMCKCVCKPWRSTIRSRPFKDTYRKKNSGLLMYNYRYLKGKRDICFFHCPLCRRDELPGDFSPLTEFDLVKQVEWYGSGRVVTDVVDGMLCSYAYKSFENKSSVSGLTLHNICTGENMRILDPLSCADTFSVYNVGYDGVNKVYKLLRLIFLDKNRTLRGAHIMTLRPSSGQPSTWRELANCGLPIDLNNLPIDLNNLYRARACSDDGLLCWLNDHEFMVWFDLNNERFQLVELPENVKCEKKNCFML